MAFCVHLHFYSNEGDSILLHLCIAYDNYTLSFFNFLVHWVLGISSGKFTADNGFTDNRVFTVLVRYTFHKYSID